MSSVHDAAQYFIRRAHEEGNLITHLKLQKLCYYAQGYALALSNEPMFEEEIEAWEHGPVVRALFDEYRSFRRSPIPPPEGPLEMEPWRRRMLEMVQQRYGWMPAWELRNQTHLESPWQEAWLSDDPRPVLSIQSMKIFFRTTLRGQRLPPAPKAKPELLRTVEEDNALREATARGRADLRAGRKVSWTGSSGRAV
ncbi:MAG: DUF4065 domain-containing protein [Chloroflexi bacterium]|nr:DUF4065 domain-containing protein [Chloroflexota bacterium]